MLAPDDILAFMEPGREYFNADISGHFGANGSGVWNLLNKMVKAGDLEKRREVEGYVYWRPLIVRRREPLNTSVAGPAISPDLKSTISGYDAALRTRAELAMLARPR